jgi:CubicO group peptidase (beta-lactamase class C family)
MAVFVPPFRAGLFRALLLIVVAVPAWAGVEPSRLAGFVEHGMDLWHVPGLAVTVVSSDEVLFQQGFGETSVDNGRPVDEHTLFANASTTKAMVAAGILMLVDEGRLGLDDLVIKHVPELHFSDALLDEQLTLRDLLSHRTGLPSTDLWTFFQGMPLDEQIRRLESVPAAAPIRTRHIYQNTMFEILGLVIERVSGQRWDRFLHDRLWQPIGMGETFGARGQIPPDLAPVSPHVYQHDTVSVTAWDLPADETDAAGSVWSSIHDMALWAQFLLRGGVTASGHRLLAESSYAEMFKPQALIDRADFYPVARLTSPNWISYGLGWFQQDFEGRKIDFHTGSLSGLIAIIGLDRAGDRAVVVMGNRDHAEMRHAVLWEVMDQEAQPRDWNQVVFDLYADLRSEAEEKWKEKEKQRLRGTRPSLSLKSYAGRYDSPATGPITISHSDGQLTLETGKMNLPLSHWHLDTFLIDYEPWQMHEFATFRIAPDGSIGGLELFGQTLKRDASEN